MKVTKIQSMRNGRKTRVAAYVRVSTTMSGQDESFETQAKYYERFIRAKSEWEFAGVYGERISGTQMENRPEFNRLIEDALAMKIDLIYCKSVSRWARNTVDALKWVQILKDAGVGVIFEQEGIDTRDPGMVMILSLTAAVAQKESESISENIRWLYRNRAEKGIFIPQKGIYFGYNTDDKEFKPDENAKYVQLMFKRYAEGAILTEIADEVNRLGARTTQGNKFSPAAVSNILHNEVYAGDIHYGKNARKRKAAGKPVPDVIDKYLKDHHEAIVGRVLWEKVQARLDANAKKCLSGDGQMEKVLDILRQDAGLKSPAIARITGLDVEKVRGCVRELKRDGILVCGEDKQWSLVEKEGMGKIKAAATHNSETSENTERNTEKSDIYSK